MTPTPEELAKRPSEWAMKTVMSILASSGAEMTEGLMVKFADALADVRRKADDILDRMVNPPHFEKKPSAWATEKAASLWTYPQHASKEMDGEFAMSIAHALDSFKDEAIKDAQQYRTEIESLLKRIDQKLTHQDQLIRDQQGKLEVFDTMKRLFDSGRNQGGLVGMEESLSWLIRQTLQHGTPYPEMNSAARERV